VVVPDSTQMRSPMWIDYGRRGRYKGDHASVIMKSNRSILGYLGASVTACNYSHLGKYRGRVLVAVVGEGS
jgi:hypothetical protein